MFTTMPRSGPRSLVLLLAASAAVFTLARVGTCSDGERRLKTLLAEAKALTGPLVTEREFDSAKAKYDEGVRIIASGSIKDREVPREFLVAAADWEIEKGRYAMAAELLGTATGYSRSRNGDRNRLLRDVEELRQMQKEFDAVRKVAFRKPYEDAVGLMERFVKAHPRYADDQVRFLGSLYESAGERQKALSTYQMLASKHRGTRKAEGPLLYLAIRQMESHETKTALKAFQEILRVYGDKDQRAAVHLAVAQCYIELGQRTEALSEVHLAEPAEDAIPSPQGREAYRKRLADAVAKARVLKGP